MLLDPSTTRALGLASLAVFIGAAGSVSSSEEVGMEERCRREVLELHQFFQDWFNGELADTDESFARFSGVMDEGFVLISPSGKMTQRDALVERLRGAHRSWREDGGDAGRIWIENFRLHRLAGDFALVTYEEWQEVGGEVRGRLSTAFFGRRDGTPNGVVWLHLHEVWL